MPLLASTTDEDATSKAMHNVTGAILAPFFHCLFLILLKMVRLLQDRDVRSGHTDNINRYKGPFTNDVRREGEGGGCPNSDAVREVA